MSRALKLTFLVVSLLACGAQAKLDRNFRECPDCPEMVGIPAGKFLMGSPAHEPGRFDSEGPQHAVTLRAFALAKYPVTSEEFLNFLRATSYQPEPCNPMLGLGWKSPGRGFAYSPGENEPLRWPAVCLGWKDAHAYIDWLNKKVRAARPELAARKDGPYRLPSESEWEYAARAGTNTSRWWGEEIGSANANCNGCGSQWDDKLLAPVDSFAPNPFGLYGLLGNAWAWTQDCWHPSYVGAPADGSAWMDAGGFCIKHAIRGGAWNNVPIFIRAAARIGTADGQDFDYSTLTGFRVARDLP